VVSTPLKNISQLGLLFPIYGKIKFMFQTTNQIWLVPPRKHVGHVCIFHLFIYQYDLPNLCDHTFSQSLLGDPALPLAKLTSSRGVTVPSPKTGSKKGKRETPGSWVSPSYKSLFKFPNKTTNLTLVLIVPKFCGDPNDGAESSANLCITISYKVEIPPIKTVGLYTCTP